MGKTSSKVKDRYNAKAYDEIKIRVKKGEKETIKAHAESKGESLNGFINRAIDETMERDKSETDKNESDISTWDPDYTKLTPSERKALEEAENDPEVVNMDDIDWD